MKTRDRNATAERQPLKFSQEDFQGRFGAGQVQTPLATMASVWMLSELVFPVAGSKQHLGYTPFSIWKLTKKKKKRLKLFLFFPISFSSIIFLFFCKGENVFQFFVEIC